MSNKSTMPTSTRIKPVFFLFMVTLLTSPVMAVAAQDYVGWETYGGDEGNSHYSQLQQINRENVAELVPIWSYSSAKGRALPVSSELQVNPVVVEGVLYGRSPLYNVFALEADTGREIWRYDPSLEHVGLSNMRGVSYWQGEGVKRILFTTGHYLQALDAVTGKAVNSFGSSGRVDLREDLGRDPQLVSINAPSPGVIFDNLIIMGSAVTEGAGAAPGDIRAYHVLTGDLAWVFHTIPHPGEVGYGSWPKDAWKTVGGANAWAGMSVDAARGVVYVPTGSPTPDFDGSQRKGDNLFGNSIIALDARTGRRLWHYQTVHHDLWDRDLSSAPTLVTVNKEGRSIDMLAQASKQGVVYLLNRDDGKPVFPIEEVPVPESIIAGEQASKTQPRVTLPEPFSRQAFGEQDLSNINPQVHGYVKGLYETAQKFAFMRPFGLQKTILSPGFYGGANWGGGAYDPQTNLYYINAMEAPGLVHMEELEIDKGSVHGLGELIYRKQCSGCHGAELQGFYPYAPPLKKLSGRLARREAIRTVREGKGRMMPFAHLPAHELEAVVSFLYAQSDHNDESAGVTLDNKKVADNGKETVTIFAGYNDFVDERYYPAIKPPWGTLNAINLATGKKAWQVTLGEYDQLSKEGVPPTGTRNYGGPVVTAGGLLIIAATSDEMLRIFDKRDGELLWQYKLPAAGYATPSTYAINGRQYVVVTCSGGKLGTPSGDKYIAFGLPLK